MRKYLVPSFTVLVAVCVFFAFIPTTTVPELPTSPEAFIADRTPSAPLVFYFNEVVLETPKPPKRKVRATYRYERRFDK